MLVAAGALAAGVVSPSALTPSAGATAPSSAAAPAVAATDPRPVATASTWLAGQLVDGVLVGPAGPDYSLTIDAGLALRAVDALPDVVASISDAVQAELDDFVTGGDPESLYADPVARAAVFAFLAGEDPRDFGGRDLVADLETLAGDGPVAGRLSDVSPTADSADTIAQSFAAFVLQALDSPEADEVTDFLLEQQCDEGWFRLSFAAPTAIEQGCDAAATATPSTDATAIAVITLTDSVTDPTGDAVVGAAADWLVETQGADGSWGDSAPSAATTGLAAWALSRVDDPAARAAGVLAATWLRSLQADDVAPCTTALAAERGAVAPDGDALRSGAEDGLDATLTEQYRAATARALPALVVTPAGTYVAEPTSTSGFVQAGSAQAVRADFLAPGEPACFARRGVGFAATADATGIADTAVTLPSGSGKRSYQVRLRGGAVLGSITFRALAATKFTVSVKNKRVVGTKQRVVIRGLTQGESIAIRYLGRVVERARATKRTYRTSFDVVRLRGKQRVQVFGEFGNRNGGASFRVVKRR